MTWRIIVAPSAKAMLHDITDRRVCEALVRRMRKLADDPEHQGKPLLAELAGYQSVQAAGRYRIIYRLDRSASSIYVVAVGMRKERDRSDVYALTKRLLNLGLLP